jgi:hypothetical protein
VDASKPYGLKGNFTGGLFADIDNDGDLDFYAINNAQGADRLWRNDGLRFVDITPFAGNPSDDFATEGAAWLDYDRDGWIDLYVANYERPPSQVEGERGIGTPDQLYHNERYGRFSAVDAETAGLQPPFGRNLAGRGVNVADYDDDGDQDIFVSNYRLQENLLWVNHNDGTFANRARQAGVAGYSIDGWWGHTIGSCWGDIDNDGDLDLFSANLAHPRYEYFSDKSQLLINTNLEQTSTSGPRFTDARGAFGITYEETHSNPTFADFNNDGFLDLYVTSTYAGRRSFLYLNVHGQWFVDATYLSGARVHGGWGCAWADYDLDGDLDLVVGSPAGVKLLRNDTETDAEWLQVICTGAMPSSAASETLSEWVAATGGEEPVLYLSNNAGIGCRVILQAGDLAQLREIQSGEGTTSGNELIAHFGLGQNTGPYQLIVRFPSGRIVTSELSEISSRIVIAEPVAEHVAEEAQED